MNPNEMGNMKYWANSLSSNGTTGSARIRRNRTVPWEGIKGDNAPDVFQPAQKAPPLSDLNYSRAYLQVVESPNTYLAIPQAASPSSSDPAVSYQTPESFLHELTSAQIAGWLADALRAQRRASGRWHMIPSSPASTEFDLPDMGTLNAVPHVTYTDRRASFLEDEFSTYSRSVSIASPRFAPVASQTPQDIVRCWNCNALPYPTRQDESLPVTPQQSPGEFYYSRHVVQSRLRPDAVERISALEQMQAILRWETDQELEGLRMQRAIREVRIAVERFVEAVKEKMEKGEVVVRSKMKVLRR